MPDHDDPRHVYQARAHHALHAAERSLAPPDEHATLFQSIRRHLTTGDPTMPQPLTGRQVRDAIDNAAQFIAASSFGGIDHQYLDDAPRYAVTIDTTMGMSGTATPSASRLIRWIDDMVRDIETEGRRNGRRITGIQVRVTLPTFTIGTVRVSD